MTRMAPEQHIYATGQLDFFTLYPKSNAHFVSETGPFFMNAMSQSPDIIEREFPRAKRLWDYDLSKGWEYAEYHQRDGYFLAWKDRVQQNLLRQCDRKFSPDEWNDLALGINIVIGNIFKFAIEHFRIHKWRKTGVIWWSLLDMWPMMFNYSVVDSNFRPKQPTYDWIRQSQQASCLAAEASEDGGTIRIFALNDTLKKQQGRYRILTLAEGGAEKELAASDFVMELNATTPITKIANPGKPALWILEWTLDGKTSFNHFVCGKPPIPFETYREWCLHMERRTQQSIGQR